MIFVVNVGGGWYKMTTNKQENHSDFSLKIAINGFGRIGRQVLRALYESDYVDRVTLIAINEVAETETMAHLLRYDSCHGRFQPNVEVRGDAFLITHRNETRRIRVNHERDPKNWDLTGVDLVLDCTGVFGSKGDGEIYIRRGAKKVLFSHPGQSDLDATVIFGVNHTQLRPEDRIVSNGSCTTNCIVPVIDALDRAFGIESGAITTIHAAMNDQPVGDAYHQDLRRTRAAGQSIIPVDTKLHLGIGRIFPRFADRFEAISVRVPTLNVTAMDMSVTVKAPVNIQQVNKVLKDATQGALQGILDYTEQALVSVDFNHDPHSAIVDGTQTRVSGAHLVKVLVWCDNEWGFANRMLDTAWVMHHGVTR